MKKLTAAFLSALLLVMAQLTVFGYENISIINFDLLDGATYGTEESVAASPENQVDLGLTARSVILIEQSTGAVLYESDADLQLPPASITKIMTMLLVMEAIESGKLTYDTPVTATEYANKMGGSQIWLEVGETMTVDELLRATAIASANDAAAALGEAVAGSPEAFIDMMNKKAAELGMQNTNFENPNGLDAEGHISTARDIAIMSRALLQHEDITKYTSVWMDSLRGGETELVNTNKLVKYYDGCNGLKTGTTGGAGSCLSASATRDGLSLIAVVMGANSSDDRNAQVRTLLDWGFNNFEMAQLPLPEAAPDSVDVKSGTVSEIKLEYGTSGQYLVQKGAGDKITQNIQIVENVTAPVEKGQKLGIVEIQLDGEKIGEYPIVATEGVERINFFTAFGFLSKTLFNMK